MGFGMFGGWLLIIIVIFAFFYVLKDKKNLSLSDSESNDAQEILDERYARGEIDEKEYKERSETLKHH
jgi:putative membrane protein